MGLQELDTTYQLNHHHTVKAFGIVNKAEADVFLELYCFFDDPTDVSNLNSGSSELDVQIQLEHLEVHGSHTVEA